MKQKWKRIGSLILSVCMVFTMLPTMAFAETVDVDSGALLGVSGTITAFAELSADVAEQTVETGTAEDELNLPDELVVTVTTGAAITATVSGNDTATDSEAEEPEEIETTVEVSGWTSDPAYDGDTAGVYIFTPSLALPEGLTVTEGVYAPQIAVTVEEAAEPLLRGGSSTLAAGDIDITGFWPAADKNAGTAGNAIYATAAEVIAALPTTTFASIPSGGGTLAWPVTTWTDTDGYNPDVAASYTFIGVLGEAPAGYTNTNNYAPTVEVVVKALGNDVTSSFTDANFLAAVRTALGIASNAPVTDSACAEVEVLDVQQENIQSLAGIEHFTALKILACHSNQLTSLPALPSGLTTLECGSNQLTSLPALPSGLTMLTCNSNQLTSLPALPSGLITLDCSSNRLSALDIRGLSALTSCFAADQTVSLILTGSGNSYTANIELNNPDGLSSGLNYWFGVLTSTDKEITTSAFVVRIGEAASPYKLTGMLNLTYVEDGTATPTVSGFRAERTDADKVRFFFTPSTTGKYGCQIEKKGTPAPTFLGMFYDIITIGEFNIDTTSYGAVATDIFVVYLQVENAEGVKSEIYSLEVPAYTPPTDAKAPSIIEQPTNATYVQNAAATDLIVLANSTDGGTLSYQWYSNTTNSTVGGTPVTSSTINGCTPSTATVGTTYYYCVVTNTNNKATINKTATTTSEIAAITVNAPGGTVTGTMDIGGETVSDLRSNAGDISAKGWAWNAATATLTLNSSYTGSPIAVNCQSTDTVNLIYTGDVSITSGTASTIYCEGSLGIIGSGGTLTLNSTSSNSLYCAIEVNRALTVGGSADVNATCAGSGTDPSATVIYAKFGVTVSGSANLTANPTGADVSGIWVEGGDITISTTGTVTVGGGGTGGALALHNGRKLNMSGGTLALTGNPLAGRQFADLNITSGSIKIDGTPVYRALLTLPGTNTSTVVSAVSAPTSGYGISSKNPNSSGQLCFLLPAGSQTVTLTAGGNTYTGTVNVTTDNGATATLTKGSTAPTITVTRHPQNVTVTQGRISGALTTEAVASNGKPVSYQWYRWIGGIGSDNTEIMTGETNNTLTIPTNLTAGTYRYSCTYTAEGCEFVEGNVAIVTVKEPSGGGDGSSGGGGGGGGYTPTPIIPTDKQPDMPTVAKPSVSGMVKEGILSATITEQMVNDALKAAQDAAKKSGKELDGIALDFNVTGSGSYTNLNATIDAGAIDRLKEAGVKFIKIGSAVLDVTLDMGAIAEIDKQTSGTVTVSAKKITKLSDAAKKLIGNRPVFDITVSCQKNGKTEYVSNFGKGAVTLGIAYKATDKESKGNLFGVYVDKNGSRSF